MIETRRDVFQAIADPTRRSILSSLAMEAMTPNKLAENFANSRQAISKHIGILLDCGLLHQQRFGREIRYRLNNQKMKEVDIWLEPFRKIWTDRFNQLDDVLNNLKNQE